MKHLGMARVALLVAGLGLAATAWAQGPGSDTARNMHRPPVERAFGGHGIEGRWWNNPKVIEKLKLTDDQRKAFDQILLEHREKLVDLHANLEKAEIAMEPLMKDDKPDEARILAQIDKVAQARAELEKAHARYLLALRSKLTPEQWKQMQEFRPEHGPGGPGGRHDGPGRMGHGPDGPLPPPGPMGMNDDDDSPQAPADEPGVPAVGAPQ